MPFAASPKCPCSQQLRRQLPRRPTARVEARQLARLRLILRSRTGRRPYRSPSARPPPSPRSPPSPRPPRTPSGHDLAARLRRQRLFRRHDAPRVMTIERAVVRSSPLCGIWPDIGRTTAQTRSRPASTAMCLMTRGVYPRASGSSKPPENKPQNTQNTPAAARSRGSPDAVRRRAVSLARHFDHRSSAPRTFEGRRHNIWCCAYNNTFVVCSAR